MECKKLVKILKTVEIKQMSIKSHHSNLEWALGKSHKETFITGELEKVVQCDLENLKIRVKELYELLEKDI